MARCPFAVQKILPENATQGHIEPRMFILHSAGGHGSLAGFFGTSSNLESHFWVGQDGTIEQYMDTNVRADANLNANSYAISAETENSVAASRSGAWDTDPWTPQQVDSLIKLANWLADTHPKITRRLTPSAEGSGLAYHIQFGAPGPWTGYAKACPGKARIAQTVGPILAAFIAGSDPIRPPFPPVPEVVEVTPAECQKIVDVAVKQLLKEISKTVNATNSLEHSLGEIKTNLGVK